MKSIVLVACIAIAFFALMAPPQSASIANQHQQDAYKELLASLEAKQDTLLEQIQIVADSQRAEVESAVSQVRDEISDVRTKLVALQESPPKPAAAEIDCDCNCESRIAEHESRITALESQYAARSGTSGLGSTGSGLGSTGSVALPSQNYGSAGTGVATVNHASRVATPLKTATRVLVKPLARIGHWTFPGDIETHLRNDHNVNTSGMTMEQMLDEHDAIHESSAAVTMAAPITKSTVYYPSSSSSCPGGICPTSHVAAPRRSGLLGIFRR